MLNTKLINKMKNQQLEQDIDRMNGVIEIKISSNIYRYSFETDYNIYIYDSVSDMMSDCIELSRRFELVFV